MARGVLAGLITGTLVSGLVLGGLSVLIGAPGKTRSGGSPEAASVEITPGSEFDLRREDAEAALPALQEGPTIADRPQVATPAPDDLAALSGTDTTPAIQPETGAAEELAQPTSSGEPGSGIAVLTENPVLPSPQAAAPVVPATEGVPDVSGDVARIPATESEEAGTMPGAEPEEQAVPVFPVEEPAPSLMPGASASDPAVAEVVVPDEGSIGESEADSTGTPAQSLATTGVIDNRAEGVTTDRLPAITDAPQTPETPERDASADAPQGALGRNAEPFENPQGKPLMAIILMDDGSGSIDPDALQGFPYPVSFAVDVNWDGAGAAAERYRAAGFEVLAMTDLPEGASAMDAEVAMQTWLGRVPQAVAVLEGTGTGLQSSREASAQLAPILLESGHGLVMHPNGLGTVQKLIAREGVPSATLFRDFDGQGQNAAAIRRFLDQAAMKANQQAEGVIMLGRLRDETISALLVWGLQDRAASVALAPVSAVLTAQ
ncbi:Uncharacterized conserved protein YibQ, putative polysaccharide deacetylase 2 family [Roseovarius azorensis]|uniref:Uncharacterized conserved protein YibQ, putative polysaccharide deacetylase 2 family n=1 Tax=Roseovarius azorensis TaxID=1287727 RepID=A0A1H7TUZ6_9RHOB|nr:divergent polysaccharide deacetylase family protein [Roseovarius azorensis]SEL88385.1 Uncharacterized conserved protein YibQ, putative polysaccharide deacetylase 2 family [Roseovarius azorensis]